MEQAKTLNTLRKMNRPIKFFGLSSMQFLAVSGIGALIIVIIVFQNLHPFILLFAIIGMFSLFSFAFAKLNREHKKGNPDYITGRQIMQTTPKKIIDKTRYFKIVKK